MSFGQMVKFLIFLLDREGIDLCFNERERWHALFYQLKFPIAVGMPSALDGAFFELNGPAPNCPELDAYLDGLRLSGCVECSSPSFRGYRLVPGVAAVWAREYRDLPAREKKFLEAVALPKAQKEFPKIAA